MLYLNIIQVGKTKEVYVKEAENEYKKRLGPYTKITVYTVSDDEKIMSRIDRDTYVISLVIKGKQLSSTAFANHLKKIGRKKHITFIIGGPHGLPESVIQCSDMLLSFSRMTFTHQMIRMILLEQIYRACTIIEGKKYHY
ncbi:23S rRNA (pseudouridine(1915)-N(3))-methyltransferase RlmH [Candidatus Peregrinibacteria bacterium]|nr:23S rRNA (pseudouridine(1915)-N(3))-methyltransferase RlmH [Candidatus Peregrinibacteria bacterium]